MSQAVTRHFVTIDGRWGTRQVHYRRAGSGPAVLLLHQSPQSSREMVEPMRRWALHFTVIAPDTPGYGQSDPLGAPLVSIEEFATALLEFVDAIGLRRFGVYGYHTGASIGLWLAARHPQRVTALAANGLAQFTDEERDIILEKYLPPLVPRWDGGHLAWLWARVREQTVFFPWHERTAQARMDFDMPAPERLHASVMDFLRAGDNYAVAYRAAFESRPETVLPSLQVPLLVTAANGDPLQVHLHRYRNLPHGVQLQPAGTAAEALELSLQHLLAHRGDECPAAVATRPVAGRLWNTMVRTDSGQVRVLGDLSGREEPLLLLHHAGESADSAVCLIEPLVGSRPIAIPDLPGHGESDPPQESPGPTVAECAHVATVLLNRVGLHEVVLAGQGSGACVAAEMARQGLLRQPRLVLLDLPCPPDELFARLREHGLPSLAPEWHGAHLLLAWHMVRDGRLFFPWFDRSRRAARRIAPDLDESRLQLEVRELLKADGCWQPLLAEALNYPLVWTLQQLDQPVVLGAGRDSTWAEATRAAANSANRRFVPLPPGPATWLPDLLAAQQTA